MIEIIVETGEIVEGANSYSSLEETRAYAIARNITLPVDDEKVKAAMVRATDYLESKGDRYKGSKVLFEQSLQWPRERVAVDNFDLSASVIPKNLKAAQIELAIAVCSGVDLFPTRANGFVKKEVLGPMTTEYSETIGTSIEPTLTAVNALLAPLYSGSVGISLKTFRA